MAIAACWFGVFGLYVLALGPDSDAGHPLATTIALVVIALAAGVAITGSTIAWRATHTARKRDAQLGLATGRRWWPGWLVGLSCLFVVPGLLITAGAVATGIAESASPTPLTQAQVNEYMTPAMIAAGVAAFAGFVYIFGIRDYLRERETRRLRDANRDYLASDLSPDEDDD
jgi:hypothetical protein